MYVSLLKTISIICFGTKLWCFSLRSPVTSKPSMPFIRARTSWAFVISASWWKGFGWVFAHNRLTFMFKSLLPLWAPLSPSPDQHHLRWKRPEQSIPLCQHWSGEVPGAQLGAEPRWLLLGLCFHRPRFWWWSVGIGLGGSPLRYFSKKQIILIKKQSV